MNASRERIKTTVAKAEALVMESGALLAQRRGLLLERHACLVPFAATALSIPRAAIVGRPHVSLEHPRGAINLGRMDSAATEELR